MKKQIFWIAFLAANFFFTGKMYAAIVINEFLADPPPGIAGDANHDGVRSSSDDEFVELLNTDSLGTDLSLWSLWDGTSSRHQFVAGTTLLPLEYLVVFGGGNLANVKELSVRASTGGLSLNNSGDQILLKDAKGKVIDSIVYRSEGNLDQSLTRFPEGDGPFQLHGSISTKGLLFSPGTDPNGENLRNLSAVPEPTTFFLFSVGIFLLIRSGRFDQNFRRAGLQKVTFH